MQDMSSMGTDLTTAVPVEPAAQVDSLAEMAVQADAGPLLTKTGSLSSRGPEGMAEPQSMLMEIFLMMEIM